MSKEINQIYAGVNGDAVPNESGFNSAITRIKRLEFQIFHLQQMIIDEPAGKRQEVMKALLEGYNLRLSKMMAAINEASQEAHNASQALNKEQLDLFLQSEQSEVH